MNFIEAVKRACQEPTLIKALTWICIWDSERIVRQAKKSLVDANGKGWDTCFRLCLASVIDEYGTPEEFTGIEKPEAISARDFADGLPYAGEWYQPDDRMYLKKPMDKYIKEIKRIGMLRKESTLRTPTCNLESSTR